MPSFLLIILLRSRIIASLNFLPPNLKYGDYMHKNHIVFIVMDSCRYDSFLAAKTPNIDRIGEAEKRYSYASWTTPSHYAFTMGMMPHSK